MSTGLSALILGSTGQTGQHLLTSVLASSHFSKVSEYGRRVTEISKLGSGKEKLEQKVIDFEKLDDSGLKDGKWDVVFIALGTTRRDAGSAKAFQKIDKEYVVNAAQLARNPEVKQRLVYCSSTSANSGSMFLYPRSKGETEEALAAMGWDDPIMFRPGMLTGTNRPGSRIVERSVQAVTGALSKLSDGIEIKVATLGKSMAIAGALGSEKLPKETGAFKAGKDEAKYTVISNAGALALARSAEL